MPVPVEQSALRSGAARLVGEGGPGQATRAPTSVGKEVEAVNEGSDDCDVGETSPLPPKRGAGGGVGKVTLTTSAFGTRPPNRVQNWFDERILGRRALADASHPS